MTNVKDNIKFILKRRGMTQVQLAEKLGVSKQQMQYYLTGNTSLKSLQRIAIALDTTLEAIVSETPLSAKDDPVPTRSISTTTRLVCPHCGKEIEIVAKT